MNKNKDSHLIPILQALLVTFLVASVLITFASLFVLQVERGAPDATIKTGTEAYWWAFVTMTTVGYGDYVPVTLLGQLMAMVLMTFGAGIFAVLTGFLATKLLAPQEDDQESEQDIRAIVREEMAQLRQENAAMCTQISELAAMLKKPESGKDDASRSSKTMFPPQKYGPFGRIIRCPDEDHPKYWLDPLYLILSTS